MDIEGEVFPGDAAQSKEQAEEAKVAYMALTKWKHSSSAFFTLEPYCHIDVKRTFEVNQCSS